MTFYSGQRVTLKEPEIWTDDLGIVRPGPSFGEIVVVLATRFDARWKRPEFLVIRGHDEPKGMVYWAHLFRPVVDRSTDIAVFKKLLQPKPWATHLDGIIEETVEVLNAHGFDGEDWDIRMPPKHEPEVGR